MKKKSKPESKPKLKLWVVLLGGRPADARIEQHNVFWGAAYELKDLYGAIKRSWLAARQVHIDAHMCVEQIGDYEVVICKESELANLTDIDTEKKLFFVNLGGYQEGMMTEMHKRVLIVASSEDEATLIAKKDKFFEQGINIENTVTHIDDKHQLEDGLDIEIPINIGSAVKQQGFKVCFKKVRSGSDVYPKVVVGYYKIP
jgi:hypothetical protein